jgi:acetyl/propionyl-CoA carboxylase alpha subunit
LAIARLGDAPRTYRITRGREDITVVHRGVVQRFRVLSRLEAMARMAVEGVAIVSDIKASMPGLVTAIEVEAGATVDAGDTIVVLEAMKLVFTLQAKGPGRVRTVRCKVGATVATGDLLVEMEPVETTAQPGG